MDDLPRCAAAVVGEGGAGLYLAPGLCKPTMEGERCNQCFNRRSLPGEIDRRQPRVDADRLVIVWGLDQESSVASCFNGGTGRRRQSVFHGHTRQRLEDDGCSVRSRRLLKPTGCTPGTRTSAMAIGKSCEGWCWEARSRSGTAREWRWLWRRDWKFVCLVGGNDEQNKYPRPKK